MDIKGANVLLTGASAGIGRCLAETLATRGCNIVLAARSNNRLEDVARSLPALGARRVESIPCDLSVRGEAQRLGGLGAQLLGDIDLLINNAGISLVGSQGWVADDDVARRLLETNYWSPLALIRSVLPQMRLREAGMIVNMTSIVSVNPIPYVGHYAASKAALCCASEALRLELKDSGVRTLQVVAGAVDTGLLAEISTLESLESLKVAMSVAPAAKPGAIAKRVARAIERDEEEVVYPGSVGMSATFPRLTRMLLRRLYKPVPSEHQFTMAGGSQGDQAATNIRKEFR